MNTPQQARPATGTESPGTRAGPEPVLSSIPQQPVPEAESLVVAGQLAQPAARDEQVAKRVVRCWRYLLPLFAGGTVVTAMAAVRALGWTAEARPGLGHGSSPRSRPARARRR